MSHKLLFTISYSWWYDFNAKEIFIPDHEVDKDDHQIKYINIKDGLFSSTNANNTVSYFVKIKHNDKPIEISKSEFDFFNKVKIILHESD